MADPGPVHELYGVDPDAFVDARNRLAKQLRAGGRRDEAAHVAGLRRPPPTAWALNQVARRHPELIDAVLDAGGRLREAVEDALGGDPSGLRSSQGAERRAVDAAVAVAARLLEGAGRKVTDAVKLRMAASLRAAVVDPSVAGLVRGGVLDADRDAPGFGLDGLSSTAGPAARPRRATSAHPAPPAEAEPGPEPGPDDQAQAQAQAADHRRLANEAGEAEDRARRLEREAAEAQRRAGQLAGVAAEATAEAQRATRRAEQVQADARAAARQAAAARAAADAAGAHASQARRGAQPS